MVYSDTLGNDGLQIDNYPLHNWLTELIKELHNSTGSMSLLSGSGRPCQFFPRATFKKDSVTSTSEEIGKEIGPTSTMIISWKNKIRYFC